MNLDAYDPIVEGLARCSHGQPGMLGLCAWLRRRKKPSGQAAARRTA